MNSLFLRLVLSSLLTIILGDKKYLINTTGCKIPNYKVHFDDKPSSVSCGQRLVFIKKLSATKIKFNITWGHFDHCCYSYINRSKTILKEDEDLIYSSCKNFKNQDKVDLNSDLIRVQCTKKKKITYTDYYAFVKRIKRRYFNFQNEFDDYNVLMLGLDTISRARAYNSLEKTIKYLHSNEWLDFQGYTKVGTNTRPNAIATLTGKLIKSCKENITACNDSILWKKYRESGYVTAYAEDSYPYCDSLLKINNLSLSSPIQPTDHYLRPLFKSQQKIGSSMCIGKVNTGLQVLKYALDFVNAYKNENFFGFFWIMNFGHDGWQSPKSLDPFLTDFLTKVSVSGVLNRTFVILFSDHGLRFGEVRYHIDTFYEERMPMFFMHIPDNFEKNHPDFYSNLVLNQKRLISPFDLHLTLSHILDPMVVFKKANDCKTCSSLFYEIPENRRCADAGIDDIWCTCHECMKASIETDHSALTAVLKSYTHLKDLSKNFTLKRCTYCEELNVEKLLRVNYFLLNDNQYYVTAFQMKGGVVFEVIVKRLLLNNVYSYEIVWYESISTYNFKGDCVLEYKYRRFCGCKKDYKCYNNMSRDKGNDKHNNKNHLVSSTSSSGSSLKLKKKKSKSTIYTLKQLWSSWRW